MCLTRKEIECSRCRVREDRSAESQGIKGSWSVKKIGCWVKREIGVIWGKRKSSKIGDLSKVE